MLFKSKYKYNKCGFLYIVKTIINIIIHNI